MWCCSSNRCAVAPSAGKYKPPPPPKKSVLLFRNPNLVTLIKTYARNTTGQARLSALASMAIERDLLLELKRTVLHDRVIELFLKKERRMDFIFK